MSAINARKVLITWACRKYEQIRQACVDCRADYSREQAFRWLFWLAQRMEDLGLQEFYVEHLQANWLPHAKQRRRHALAGGLAGGLALGLVYGLDDGGTAVINHILLRRALACHNYLPYDLVPYLDHMARLILLRRVGGGYRFIHRTMQEHIAALTQADIDFILTGAPLHAAQPNR